MEKKKKKKRATHLPFLEVQLEDDCVRGIQPLVIILHYLIRHEPESFIERYGLVIICLHVEIRVHDEGVCASLVQRVL